MAPPPDVEGLSPAELRALVVELLGRVAALERTVGEQREEIARLKGLKGPPRFPPSGMERETEPKPPSGAGARRGRGKAARLAICEERVLGVAPPAGSRFKGYAEIVVQELELRVRAIRYRRERWRTPDGGLLTAPLPAGIVGHFGPQLRRFVLAQHHEGQVATPRLLGLLRSLGVALSKRQLVRLLIAGQDGFLGEARAVLRAGLQTAAWVSCDDTGARHKGANGHCTQIGDDRFAWFGTTASKSRRNFLELLRAGHGDYLVDDTALAYMRGRHLSERVVARLAAHPDRRFADEAAWRAHLKRLAIDRLKVTPDPPAIATEGALWAAVRAHGFLADAVVLSDGAGQFAVGRHALCWVHAERLVHRLDAFNERDRQAQRLVRGLIWAFYRDLKAWRAAPGPQARAAFELRFDAIFGQATGFVALDKLLKRLRADKAKLLMVLQRPELPLHTNGSENDLRCQVVKRKISGGTRSDAGRDCRDAFLGLLKTCQKLGLSFWDYLGHRLNVPDSTQVPYLPHLVAVRAQNHRP
jgi:hypothetical protein